MRTFFGVLLLAAVTLVTFGCFQRTPNTSQVTCTPGVSDVCYSGPTGTDGVGICHRGQLLCWEEGGTTHEQCVNEVVPQRETCNGLDDDCDGEVDNNGACQVETVADVVRNSGPVSTIWKPEIIGPFALAGRLWGAIHYCESDHIARACADEFIARYGRAYGIYSADEQLRLLDSLEVGDTGVYRFQQVHRGVDVDRGEFSVSVAGNQVTFVLATMLPVPSNLDTTPQLTPEDALASLPQNPDSEAASVKLVVFTKPLPSGSLPAVEDQTKMLAYRIDLGGVRYFVDAMTGDLIWKVTQVWSDLQIKIDGKDTQPSEDPQKEAWTILEEFYAYATEDDDFDLADHNKAPNKGAGGHFSLWFATKDTNSQYCGNTTAGITCADHTAAGCSDKTHIYFCDGGYDREALIHEAGHHLFLQSYSGSTVYGWSVDEALTMFHTELFECARSYSGDPKAKCDWNHRGYVFTSQPSSLNISQDDAKIYDNAAIIDRAFYLIWQAFADKLAPDGANRKMRELLYHAVRFDLGGLMDVKDVFPSFLKACIDLTHIKSTYPFDMNDCQSIRTAFATVQLANCDIPGPAESCNGLDDDCNGLVDDGDAYGEPLTRSCPWDPTFAGPAAPEIGACRNGVQTCVNGAWGPCVGAVTPKIEKCNQIDDDCDGWTDEEVQEPFAPDYDGDGYWADNNVVYACHAIKPFGYIARVPGKMDCNDHDKGVHPGAAEICGDLIDNNCNGAVDEGCGCNPSTDKPLFCGYALKPSCKGAPFDSSKAAGCTLGSYPWCVIGEQRCEFDWITKTFKYSDVCYGSESGGPEVCDGLDNDCDGLIDDNPIGLSPVCGNGGHEECKNGQIVCTGEKPTTECTLQIAASASTPPFIPPCTSCETGGDGEFNGNGPKMTATVSVALDPTGTAIVAHVCLRAEETGGNWSVADGCRYYTLIAAPAGCTIDNFTLSPKTSSYSYTDTDHEEDVFEGSPPVQEWRFVGDTQYHNDAGGYTFVSVRFVPFYYQVCCPKK